MPYRFVTERPNYEIFASGQVFYSQPGQPAFPVRLASEIFQRCLAIRESNNLKLPVTVYDPCCGSAYHLSVIACLHWESIHQIIASDIDPEAVQLAARNLNLLTPHGLDNRISELFVLLQQYGKESHQTALEYAEALRGQVADLSNQHPIETQVFQANAFNGDEIAAHLQGQKADIVFTDIPYGLKSQWQGVANNREPVWQLLDSLRTLLAPNGLVAVASDKGQKITHEAYRRVEQFKVGKRQVVILRTA